MKPLYIRNASDFARIVVFKETRESEVLEFKLRYDPRTPEVQTEIRKDVLALANTWGGVILVGVDELNDIAIDAVSTGAEEHEKRIVDVLGERVFPTPSIEPVALDVSDAAGRPARVLAVNVMPFANGVGCYRHGNDGESVRFPRRDSRGVKFIPPMEVFTMLASNPARRIEIALNELAKTGIEIHLTSPVLRELTEAPLAAAIRMGNARSPHPHPGISRDPRPGQQVSVAFARSVSAWYSAHTPRELTITIRSEDGDVVVSVPLGLVREVWQFDARRLGVVLECDIILAGERPCSVFVRTR